MKVLDSTFLIDLLRGEKNTLKIVEGKDLLVTTQINLFEVIRGIFLGQNPTKKLLDAMELFANIRVLSLDNNSITKSADISANLYKKGEVIDDNDCLTAGIALSNKCKTIITRNKDHFKRIKDLKIETY